LAALGVFGTLIAALIVWILFIKPAKPACLVLLGANYDVNLALPHNVYGCNDLKGLAGQNELRVVNKETEEVKTKKTWERLLQELPASVKEETVIVFLALHGGADDDGAYLFPGDYARGQEKTYAEKIYVKHIIGQLAEKWPHRNVLLVLEPAQLAFHWPSGMLRNDFARKLRELEPDIKNAGKKNNTHFMVMCASDVEQISWASEEWRQTIFGHFVIEGLRGAAQPTSLGRVTVANLHDYVKKRVSAWSQANRGAVQTPILLPEGQTHDVGLVQVDAAYHEQGFEQAPEKVATPSADLIAAWKQGAELSKQVPGPEVYTPQQWRQYREALVRWEQLERAGAVTGAIADECRVLRTEIQKRARVELKSMESTRALPVPAVLGVAAPPITRIGDLLWQDTDTDDKIRGRIQKALESAGAGNDKLFYGQTCRQLLVAIQKNADELATPAGLSKARRLLGIFESVFSRPAERPAEFNYLVMLLKDLDPKTVPPAVNLKKGLAVRMLAEEAAMATPASAVGHPYGEVVYAWVKPLVDDADKKRRLGEDWLFGADAEAWKQSLDLLSAAEEAYDRAMRDAAALAKALALRDRVLADLPFYADWLARRRYTIDPNQDRLTKQVDTLSINVGNLNWLLSQTSFQGNQFHRPQKPSVPNPNGQAPAELLSMWSVAINGDFQGLRKEFDKACNDVNNQFVRRHNWTDREAALAVPLINDLKLREALIKHSRDLSRNLLAGTWNIPDQEKAPEVEPLQQLQRLALAVLVRRGQNNPLVNSVEKLEPTVDAAKAAALATKLGDFWQQLPGKVAAELTKSCTRETFKEAAAPLPEADFLSRLLPGGFVPNWSEPYGPSQGLRQLRLYELFCRQAQRAKDDYWFMDVGPLGATRAPYYIPAVKGYAHMAQELIAVGASKTLDLDRQVDAKALENIKSAELAVVPPQNPNWTDKSTFPAKWQLLAGDDVPIADNTGAVTGVPMYSLKINKDSGLAAAGQPGLRRPATPMQSKVPYNIFYELQRSPGKDVPAADDATLVTVFRGQNTLGKIAPKLAKPDIIVSHFPPVQSGLAFRLDKNFDYGAICFLLDCSPSMKNKVNGKQTRIEHAITALNATLDNISPQTFVSLVVFIMEKGDKAQRFEPLRTPARWAGNRQELIDKVRQLANVDFWGYSPIAKGLEYGLEKGFPSRDLYPDGPKLIVALTDGDDNYSEGDYINPETKSEKDLAQYSERIRDRVYDHFKSSDVDLHVICFSPDDDDDKERKRASAQFEAAIKLLGTGSFKVQRDPHKLAADLELAMRPKLYLTKAGSGVSKKDDAQPVSRFERELDWRRLPPADYSTWLEGKKKLEIGKVGLDPGDLMILTLRRGKDRKLFFERDLYANTPIQKKAGNDVMISIMRNEIPPRTDARQQLIAVEKIPTGFQDPRILRQNPGFLWLDVKRGGAAAPELITWRRDYGYPAPVWAVGLPNWEAAGDVPPDTTVWWTADPNNKTFSSTFELGLSKDESPVKDVGKAKICFENVGWEKHDIVLESGKSVPKDCLVVRVRFENKKPVHLQLVSEDGTAPIGEQHLYYSAVDKYTALFWNLPNLAKSSFTVRVLSLDDLKAFGDTPPARFEAIRDVKGPPRITLPNAP
jgi:hypothetical protein